MDTQTQTGPATAGNAPLVEAGHSSAQPTGPASLSPAPDQSSIEAQRAKWRAKYHAKKARRYSLKGAPLTLDALPPASGAPNPIAAAPAAPAAVPWDSGTLKPMFDELIPAIEKADVDSLTKRAEKIAPDLALIVRQDAPWSPTAKAALMTNCPAVAAKWLNASGIGAENAGEVAIAIAVVCIWNGRRTLLAKLDEIGNKNAKPTEQGATIAQFPPQKAAP